MDRAAAPRLNDRAVLFVSYSGLYGGSERVLLDVATGLGGDPVVVCPDGPLAQRARAAGIRTFTVPKRRLELRATARDRIATPLRLAALATEVRVLARSLRPDVVFGWGTRAAFACVTGLRGLPHRPTLIFQNNDMVQGPAIAQLARWAASHADLIVAPSKAVERDLDPDGNLGTRTVVIPPGVDATRYAGEKMGSDPIFSPGSEREVLVLGAVVGWKRPRLALEAVSLAASEIPGIRLRIAGPVIDSEGERIMDLMRKRSGLPDLAGRVEFSGPLSDPAAALARADVLLHCADCEPFGIVLIEALASGTPVVAPASCGPAEIVDPSCGRHYLPGHAPGAARALVEVLGDDEVTRTLGAAGPARVRGRFSLDLLRERYRALLAEVTGASASATADADADARGAGLSIVTVIHNSEPELDALLRSIERHLPAAETIVVNSGSTDGGPDLARAWSGGATVIDMDGNPGFGASSNAGVAAATRPVTVLLNPDCELIDASLADLAAEALRPPERLLTPLIVLPSGNRQDSAQLEPGSAELAVAAAIPPAVLPRALARAVEPWRANEPRAVGWGLGACLVARTETLRRLGPFDERIFMYAEDLDLGLRATDAGIETWFWPDARVLHHSAHSTGAAFGGEPFELLARRRREVVRKWRGVRRQSVDDWVQLATFANRWTIKGLLGRTVWRERRQIEALLRVRRENGSRP